MTRDASCVTKVSIMLYQFSIPLVVEMHFYPGGEHIDRHMVLAALWNDDICIALGGFNELEVHGLDKFLVMLKHLLE